MRLSGGVCLSLCFPEYNYARMPLQAYWTLAFWSTGALGMRIRRLPDPPVLGYDLGVDFWMTTHAMSKV